MDSQQALGKEREVATLGGGCFWCTEAIFDQLKGVEKVESGYSGGKIPNPSYEDVCTGSTGHAESIQITFNPKQISFKDILQVFFTTHDPTTLNRQGADVGSQYRSAIFYHNPEQEAVAKEDIKETNAAKLWKKPVVTEVTRFKAFYKDEHYLQEYFKNNAGQDDSQLVTGPK